MKKMYQKPVTTVVNVQASSMLMQSAQGDVNAAMNTTWEEEDI